jgi:hypothetical protein
MAELVTIPGRHFVDEHLVDGKSVTVHLGPEALAVVMQIAKDEALSLSEAICFVIREYERLAAEEWRRNNPSPSEAEAWANYWEAHEEAACPPVYRGR